MVDALQKQEISIYRLSSLINNNLQNSKCAQQQQQQNTKSFDASTVQKNTLTTNFTSNCTSKITQSEHKEPESKGSSESSESLQANCEKENSEVKNSKGAGFDARKIALKPVTKLIQLSRPSSTLKEAQNSQKPLSSRGSYNPGKANSIGSVSKDKALKIDMSLSRYGKITMNGQNSAQKPKQEANLNNSILMKQMNLKVVKTQVITLNSRNKAASLTEKLMSSTHNNILNSKKDPVTPISRTADHGISSEETMKSTSLPDIDRKKVISKPKSIDNQSRGKQKLLADIIASSISQDLVTSVEPDGKDFPEQVTPKKHLEAVEVEYFEEVNSLKMISELKTSPSVNKEDSRDKNESEFSGSSKKEIKCDQIYEPNHQVSKPTSFSTANLAKNVHFTIDEAHKENTPYTLSEEETQMYGDRCPKGFKKIGFLGRGGCALVWLGIQDTTSVRVAMKQIAVQNSSSSIMKEAAIGKMLFESSPTNKYNFGSYPGINHIIKFINCVETTQDLWIVFELGGSTLSKCLFEIKGEFHKGERVYGVKNMNLHKLFQENAFYLKAFIRQMTEVLRLFSELKLVHSDIKPDNILIQEKHSSNGDPFTIKMIDFGSAFCMKDIGTLAMATPEYMPPEVLRLITSNKSKLSAIEELARISPAWAVDIWSLGAIILEILSGLPVWMSLRSRIEVKGKNFITTGLFGVKGRCYDKIRVLQKTVVDGLEKTVKKYLTNFKNSEGLLDLLISMLQFDPKKRISPEEILKHAYLNEN